jgi:hypothetical protein
MLCGQTKNAMHRRDKKFDHEGDTDAGRMGSARPLHWFWLLVLRSHQALDTVGDLVSQTAVEIDDGRMRAHAARVEIEQSQTLHRSRTAERHVLRVRGEARARGSRRRWIQMGRDAGSE